MSDSAAAQLAARLDRLPSSRTVWILVVLISLGGVFEFYDLFFTGYVAPGMIDSRLFTPESLGFFASLKLVRVSGFGTFVFCTFAGLWVGVVAFGHWADRFGRKAVFTWSLMWYVAATAIMAFQRTGQWIDIWRFVAGIGFGVQLVTVDTYIVELTPSSLRGRAFAVNQCICFSIVPVVALLSRFFVPRAPLGLEGWRWVVLFGTVGAMVVWALRAGIPESPRWLASQGTSRRRSASSRNSSGALPPKAPGPTGPAAPPGRGAWANRPAPPAPPGRARCARSGARGSPTSSRRHIEAGR